MNRRMIGGLAVAVIIGLLFSSYVYRRLQLLANARPVPTRLLVVAYRSMQLGTRLDAQNLRMISWPGDEPIPGSFSRIEDCAGRALITPVAENEPILEERLAPKEAGAGLPATIPEGMRAVSVAVNDVVGVAGFVIPGTMVDVLVTGQVPGAQQGFITRTILENVRVLAAGQKVEQDRDGKPTSVPVVTLLVSPDDAAKLTMGATQGRIQLALRNTIDTKVAEPAPVLQAVLFGGAAPPAPHKTTARKIEPPRPPSPYVVEVLTGTKKEEKAFANP